MLAELNLFTTVLYDDTITSVLITWF